MNLFRSSGARESPVRAVSRISACPSLLSVSMRKGLSAERSPILEFPREHSHQLASSSPRSYVPQSAVNGVHPRRQIRVWSAGGSSAGSSQLPTQQVVHRSDGDSGIKLLGAVALVLALGVANRVVSRNIGSFSSQHEHDGRGGGPPGDPNESSYLAHPSPAAVQDGAGAAAGLPRISRPVHDIWIRGRLLHHIDLSPQDRRASPPDRSLG